MNLLLLFPGEVLDDEVAISGRRAQHVLEVLGKQPGETVKVGVMGDGVCEAEVTATLPTETTVRLRLSPRVPRAAPKTSLVLALPRPKALSRIIQLAASFGVRHVDLVPAHKVDRSYFSSPRLHPERMQEDALLGLEQGGLVHLPTFQVHRHLGAFAKALLGEGTRVSFHPAAKSDLVSVLRAGGTGTAETGEVTLAFGPDGGFLPEELDLFAAAGFSAVALFSPTLRTEVAVAAGLGQLALARRLVDGSLGSSSDH